MKQLINELYKENVNNYTSKGKLSSAYIVKHILIALKRSYTGQVAEVMTNILYSFFSRGWEKMD